MQRVGVIGCGLISFIHFEAIEKNNDVELVAICDINEEALFKSKEKHGCNAYIDYNEMLTSEKLDVVHICTPHYLHKDMIITALTNNTNVICEKPVVMNMAEAKEIEEVQKGSSAKVAVTLQNRYNPTSVVMREYVDNGTLGKLTGIKGFVTWSRDPKQYYRDSNWRGKYATEGGSLVINQAIHTIDLIQWLGGDIAKFDGSYSTKAFKEYIDTEDTAEMYFEFENGAKGLFYGTNGYVANSPVEMELQFESGLLKYMFGKLYLVEDEEFKLLARDFEPGLTGPSYWGASHQKAIYSYYDAFKNDSDYIDLDDATQVIAILDQLRQIQPVQE